jgi:hypothetical protein
VLVSRSTDRGRKWSEPIPLIADTDPTVVDDKESITADPHDSRLVYAVWDRLVFSDATQTFENGGPTWFSRTTNGGESWEKARIIYDPGFDAQTISNQIVVLPSGDLVDVFVLVTQANEAISNFFVAVVRSSNKGVTWSKPTIVNTLQSIGVVDPKTGEPLRTGDIIPDIAVDSESGRLYLSWQDARFSALKRDGIVLSTSKDGGVTWSAPVQVNKAASVQAFTAAVQVADDGALGLTYYDFRNDNADPKVLLTDYWKIVSHDSGKTFKETHVAGPFDMRTAPFARGFFVGDYEGLGHVGDAFLPFFVLANSGNVTNRTDVFAAQVGGEDQQGGSGNEGAGSEQVNTQPRPAQELVRSHRESRGNR